MAELTITQPRQALAHTIAGLLAEASVKALDLHLPGAAPQRLTTRTVDLPARLREAPLGTRVATEDGHTITLTAGGCTVTGPAGSLLEAFAAINGAPPRP
ncbi:MAG: hypothetical protein Q8L55_13855 [Phycisphaerales bacterium]|nr:hypothetical protein [Phycisphaerales bacterium]